MGRTFGIRLLRIFSLSRVCVCKRLAQNLISRTYFDIVIFQVLMTVTKEFGLLRCYALILKMWAVFSPISDNFYQIKALR